MSGLFQRLCRRGFFKPVVSLFLTSRFTRAARTPSYSPRNSFTAPASCTASARKAHDRALVTVSSGSLASKRQSRSVRVTCPVPPCEREFRATVLTNAARRHQRSSERAHRRSVPSRTCLLSQAGPYRMRAKASTDPQLLISLPSLSTAASSRHLNVSRWLAINSRASHRRSSSLQRIRASRTTNSGFAEFNTQEYLRRIARRAGVLWKDKARISSSIATAISFASPGLSSVSTILRGSRSDTSRPRAAVIPGFLNLASALCLYDFASQAWVAAERWPIG